MQNGYHTAKVEWIKDEPIPEEELGNLKIIPFVHLLVWNIDYHLKLLETGKLSVCVFWEGLFTPQNNIHTKLKR